MIINLESFWFTLWTKLPNWIPIKCEIIKIGDTYFNHSYCKISFGRYKGD